MSTNVLCVIGYVIENDALSAMSEKPGGETFVGVMHEHEKQSFLSCLSCM